MCKKYIIIAQGISNIGGGQFHYKNKYLCFMEKGFDTYIISCCENKNILVEGLYVPDEAIFPELCYSPTVYTKKRQQKVINKILNYIDFKDGDKLVVESTYLEAALWGELIAAYCKGKNIVYLLAEKFKKNTIKAFLEFLDFKYYRGELANITPSIMQEMFKPFKDLVIEECRALRALSWNELVDNPLSNDINKESDEKVIGVFSRMNKPFVPKALVEIENFCKAYKEQKFLLVLIGEVRNSIIDILGKLKALSNVRILELGNVYPLPKDLFKFLDVCIASSGAASLAAREIPTISCDAITYKAIGIVGLDTFCTLQNKDNLLAKSLFDYLYIALFQSNLLNDCVERFRSYIEPIINKEKRIEEHFSFIENSAKNKEYFSKKIKLGFNLMLYYFIKKLPGSKSLIKFIRKVCHK